MRVLTVVDDPQVEAVQTLLANWREHAATTLAAVDALQASPVIDPTHFMGEAVRLAALVGADATSAANNMAFAGSHGPHAVPVSRLATFLGVATNTLRRRLGRNPGGHSIASGPVDFDVF